MLINSGTVGKYVGGYYISLELASSPSSRTFLGESVSPDQQQVAIKRLYTVHLASKQQQESFSNEASLLKQFDHPYILPLLSADVIKGTPYIVSEYAPNGSLQDRLQRLAPEPMLQDEALTILSQVGQALHYAHQQKRSHGNVKPQNILFNAKGVALLADFKFASLSSLSANTTASDNATATTPTAFSYMAPEQIEGMNSMESDQYALGCIAYEMFTGRKPFITPSLNQPGMYYKTRTPIAPGKLNPALPPHIEQAILKALAKEPAQRHGSVLEFIKALGTPGILVVPDAPPSLVRIAGKASPLASRPSLWGKPLFPNLKVANTGAMTLAQFTNRAALFRNTLAPLTHFSSAPSHGKRNLRRPLLVTATLLLITAITAVMIFASSPSRELQGNKSATLASIPKTTIPQPLKPSSATTARPTANNRGGVIVPSQPTHIPHAQPTHALPTPVQQKPTQPPTPKPSPTVPPTNTLSVAPASLNSTNCTPGNGFYTCFVALSLGAAATNSQNWYTYSLGVGANFTPSSSTIAPGQTIHIQITVFNTCTKTGTFVFVGAKTNVTVAWNC